MSEDHRRLSIGEDTDHEESPRGGDELLPVSTRPSTATLGIIGGSSLFHAEEFSKRLTAITLDTDFGGVVAHVGEWYTSTDDAEKHHKTDVLRVIYVQRHHANPDGEYKQPRQINFRAIVTALKNFGCDAVLGVYSVGSMNSNLTIGRLVVPEDYFNPFDILHMSEDYNAHVVPEVNSMLRTKVLQFLNEDKDFDVHDGGVYIQTAGPRFETKAEVRFFSQFGELIGMTGANEAELLNELHVPFAMIAIIDNMANGLGEKLTLEEFKIAQKYNSERMQRAVVKVVDHFTQTSLLHSLS